MGLDSVQLIIDIENEFGISIPDAEAEKISTIRDFSECVVRLTGKELEEVEFKIMTILHESLGVEWNRLKPSARIVDDMGID